MTQITVSAPGKAVLSGEYAVLEGAPAISIALNRRAIVQVKPALEEINCVTTPGYAEGKWRFRSGKPGDIEWLDELPPQGLALVEHAWRACSTGSHPALTISIDTNQFFDAQTGFKLGFGSSAAAMTALVTALCQFAGRPEEAESISHKAHAALQGGLGSGVDIATGFHGGVIEYRRKDKSSPARLLWPDGLAHRFLWSGQPADTTALIRTLGKNARCEKSCTRLDGAARAVVDAWSGARTEEVLSALHHYTSALRQFSLDHALGIFDAGHDELAVLAEANGVVYKPCGAGGGDTGIALSSDELAVIRFCELAEARGFRQLPVELDECGIRMSVGDGQ